MIVDEVQKQSKGKEIIEVLIDEKNIKIWVPAMATDLRIMTKDYELNKVRALRVRKLK